MNDDTRKNEGRGKRPEVELTDGQLRASVWRSEGKYGPMFRTKLGKVERSEDGEYRETSYLNERDLLPASGLVSEAYRWIKDQKREHAQEEREPTRSPGARRDRRAR